VKIRLFGSNECEYCLQVLKILKEQNLRFEYVNAFDDDDDIQKKCDDNSVWDLPHLQFIKNGKVKYELIGEDVDFKKWIKYYKDL
jgi:glutaredoxin